MRSSGMVALAALVALASPVEGSSSGAATPASSKVSVVYQGTLSWSYVPNGGVSTAGSVTWGAVAVRDGTAYLGSRDRAVAWHYTSLKGTFSHGGSTTCTAVLDERPGYEKVGGHDDAAVGLNGTAVWAVQAQVPWDSWALRASDEPSGPCSFGVNGPIGFGGTPGPSDPKYDAFNAALRPFLKVSGSTSVTKAFDVDWSGRDSRGGGNATIKIVSSITLGTSSTPPVDESPCVVGERAPSGVAVTKQVRIYFRGKDVTGSIVNVAAGQPIVLRVECDGKKDPGATWRVGGATGSLATTTAVEDYSILDSGPKSRTDVSFIRAVPRSTLSFHFVRTPKKPLGVTARTKNGTAAVQFRIEAPTVSLGPLASTCRVGLTQDSRRKGGAVPTLALGWWDPECPGWLGDPIASGRPGVRLDWAVRATSALQQGELAMVQIISLDVNHNGIPCLADKVAALADDSAFYPTTTPTGSRRGKTVALTTGAVARWQGRDSPRLAFGNKLGTRLGIWGKWYESFYAQDYLMFRPSEGGAGANWVPIAQTEWRWWGYVNGPGPGKPFTLGAHKDPAPLRLRTNPAPPQFARAQPSTRIFASTCL